MKWLKIFSLSLTVMILIMGASLHVAPWFAINWLEDYYAEQGEDHSLKIKDWSLNLIKGKLSFHNINASWSDEKSAHVDEISVDLKWLPLIDQTVYIESMVFDGSNAPINQDNRQLSVAGVSLPQSSHSASKKTSQGTEDTSGSTSTWSIQVDSIILNNHQYDISLDTLSTQIKIQQLQVNNLSSDKNSKSDVTLQAQIAQLSLPAVKQSDSPMDITLSGTLSNALDSPTLSGNLAVENIQFSEPILSLTSINAKEMRIEESKLTSNEFRMTDLALGKQADNHFWLTLDEYWLNTLTVTQFGLASGIHYLSGLKVNNYRNKHGTIDYSIANHSKTVKENDSAANLATQDKGLPSNAIPSNEDSNNPKQSDSDFFINIEGITLQDDDDSISTIWFRDESINPNYVVPMALKALSISALSMKDLDAPFEPDVNINLSASVDNYSEINFNAQLNREAGWPVGTASLELEQFNIIPLNGYMVKAIGYRAQKGMLNVTSQVALQDENLSGETTIFLRNSKLEPEDKDTVRRVSKQISMPVDTALDLLRDDNGNLQLSIPMSGKISDPDFAYDDVMNQLGTLALKTASLHYLQQSLQPYGALISLLSFATDSIMAIRLNQLDFEANQSELNQPHKDYLDKVSKILAEKTDLELQVCPYVSKQESEQDNWLQLGQARAEAVKAYLAQYQDQNKESLAKRTTICVTEVADSPHVDLGV